MILPDSLPLVKSFLRNLPQAGPHCRNFLVRFLIGFTMHWGRMSASQAAYAVRSDVRHRAQVTRFLAHGALAARGLDSALLAMAVMNLERRDGGRWLFIVDKTCVSRQGTRTENTFSTGNRTRRKPKNKKNKRYNQKKHSPKRCHGFTLGLLISPSGYRIPFWRPNYTKEYCAAHGLDHRTESQLAAEMVRALPLPEGTQVTVLGDTAYDAAVVRKACEQRNFSWIVPVNPERVLEGPKPRPKVVDRLLDLTPEEFFPVRLTPGQGKYEPQRRVAPCRIGPKAKTRTFHVHKERLLVHSVGEVQVVFSTKEQPRNGEPFDRDKTKILMASDLSWSMAEIVELYDLRWQIELFFKELKSTLGLGHYRLEKFEAVENWVECCLCTFIYLEWYRAKQLSRRKLSPEAKAWWTRQRTYGLCQAVMAVAERKELDKLAQWSRTPTGLKKLKRLVRAARPAEYLTPP